MDWLILAGLSLTLGGIFLAGWHLGGKVREDKIRLKGLKDVNEHYQKMAEDFKSVDKTIDNAKSLLSDDVVRSPDKGGNPKIRKTFRAGYRKRT